MHRFSRSWRVTALVASCTLLLSACGTFQALQSKSPDTVTRILADIGCITAAASAGLAVLGDPAVNGAKTATGVLSAITAIGASNIPALVLTACKDTLAFAPKDAEAAAIVVANETGTTAPKLAPPKPMVGAPPVQPKAPTPVIVPVPKK